MNSGGRSCGDLGNTDKLINKCARESIPAFDDAAGGLSSIGEKTTDDGFEQIKKLQK